MGKYKWEILCFFVLLGFFGLMYPLNTCISTGAKSPNGLSDLQAQKNFLEASLITFDWKVKKCKDCTLTNLTIHEAAIRVIYIDFILIAFYSLLFLFILIKSWDNRSSNSIKAIWMITLIFSLCSSIFDIWENLAMLHFLNIKSTTTSFYSASILKWIFLWITCVGLLFLRGCFPWILKVVEELLEIISKNVLPVISLIFLYLLIWVADQGQDLIITINNRDDGPVSLYFFVCVLAALNWFYPKINYKSNFVSLRKSWNYSDEITKDKSLNYIAYVPRFLGVLTFWIVAFGIWNAQNQYNFKPEISPMALLVAFSILIFFVFKLNLFECFYKNYKSIYIAALLIFLLFPFVFLFKIEEYNIVKTNLFGLVIGFFFYGIAFAMATTIRTKSFNLVKNFRVHVFILISIVFSTIYFALFNLYAVYPSLLLQIINCWPFLSFSVVISGIVSYFGFFTFLTILKKVYRFHFPLFFILLAVLVTLVSNNHFHDLRVYESHNKIPIRTLASHIEKWIDKRDSSADTMEYPVFIINSYGGGIRAAAWTCFVVSHLNDISGNKFQNHVFAYSGVSGGSIGASLLCANMFNNSETFDSLEVYKRFFQRDFLTPILASMLGGDVISSSTSIPFRDRGFIQERLWEEQFKLRFDSASPTNRFSLNMDSLWAKDTSKHVPILFSNATEALSGRKAIACPLALDPNDFIHSIFINDSLRKNNQHIKLSTAAIVSARFPWISPAARTIDNQYFLDGGIKENSGAETASEIKRVFERIANKKSPRRKFKVYIISLKNTFPDSKETKKKKEFELTLPIKAALNVGGTGSSANRADILNEYDPITSLKDTCYFSFRPYLKNSRSSVVLPLGWKISDLALDTMIASLTDNNLNKPQFERICKMIK